MSNLNDSKIMTLKTQIAEKRTKLDGIKKFSPITNCSLEFKGERYNLRTLQKDKIISLMVELNIYKLSAKDLGLLEEFKISMYKTEDWITDLRGRLDDVTLNDEFKKLNLMEEKLSSMLSEEKKNELELADIEKSLE